MAEEEDADDGDEADWYEDVPDDEPVDEYAWSEHEDDNAEAVTANRLCGLTVPARPCVQERCESGAQVHLPISRHSEGIRPLLAELDQGSADYEEGAWWLIDSGASRSVLSTRFLKFYKVLRSRTLPEPLCFTTANGQEVFIDQEVVVTVRFLARPVESDASHKPSWTSFQLRCLVSDVQHNLISAGQVVRQGWSLVMNEDSLEVRSPEMVLTASMWAGCPWMKSSVKKKKKRVSFAADGSQNMDVGMFIHPLQEQPGSSDDPQPEPVPDVVMEADQPKPTADYAQQTKRMQVELELRRRRGHFPRHPECEACRVSKSVVQHRRDVFPDTKHHVEVFADFCFIETDDGSQAKFLASKERVSGMIGAVYCGENTDRIKSNLRAFFDSLGLAGESGAEETPILVNTDAERAVGALFQTLDLKRRIVVERSAPQQHESVGLVERTNRTLKESMSCLRQDMQTVGFDIVMTGSSIDSLLQFVTASYNRHATQHGGHRAPMQIVKGTDRPYSVGAAYLSVVHAEVPDSVESPAGSRFMPAAYLRPAVGTKGHLVIGKLDSGVKMFMAKSIKPLTRTLYEVSYAPECLRKHGSDSIRVEPSEGPPPRVEENIDIARRDRALVSPPASWIRRYGRTEGCYGCSGPSFHGRVRNRACKDRYQNWLDEQQVEGEAHMGMDQPVPMQPDVPIPAAREPEDQDMQVEDAVDLADQMDVEPPVLDVDMNPFLLSGLSTAPMPTQEKPVLFPIFVPKEGGEYTQTTMLGRKVYLSKPVSVWDETLASELDLEKAEKARAVEIQSMTNLEMGELLDSHEANRRAVRYGVRIIPCRWVMSAKQLEDGSEGVRARCVAQEIAAGRGTAASLGISSSTPSAESLRTLLALAGKENHAISTLDVSTAFMHSPLPRRVKAIVRLPQDLSLRKDSYEPVFMDVKKALNGLRIAPQAWLEHVSSILTQGGLHQCRSEPCVFTKHLHRAGARANGSEECVPVYVLVYVDDILVTAQDSRECENVMKLLCQTLKVKSTGLIKPSHEGGGELKFLGRNILRTQGDPRVLTRVHPNYFLPELTGSGWLSGVKGSQVPPDLVKSIDSSDEPLTAEAATRYRNTLGRLSWWAQSQPDALRYISLLSQGQSQPTQGYEEALRKYMRYVKTQIHLWCAFPTFAEYVPVKDENSVLVYTDASWGSGETDSKKSVSGGVFVWKGSVVKSTSRLQTSKAMSSCEAELIGLTTACQEGLGIRNLVLFLSQCLESDHVLTTSDFLRIECDCVGSTQHPPLELRTDSAPALALTRGNGLNRKVRHISLAVTFVQDLVKQEIVSVGWVSTHDLPADALTKCLGRDAFERYQTQLGIYEVTSPEPWQCTVKPDKNSKASQEAVIRLDEDLCALSLEATELVKFAKQLDVARVKLQRAEIKIKVLVLELRTSFGSGFAQVSLPGVEVVQVTKAVGVSKAVPKLVDFLKHADLQNVITMCWLSPPCTGGSPLLNLVGADRKQELFESYQAEFLNILKRAEPLLNRTSACGFELSASCSYWKLEGVESYLQKFRMLHETS